MKTIKEATTPSGRTLKLVKSTESLGYGIMGRSSNGRFWQQIGRWYLLKSVALKEFKRLTHI